MVQLTKKSEQIYFISHIGLAPGSHAKGLYWHFLTLS